MSTPGPDDRDVVASTAWFRKQLLDQAAEWCDRFVLAMRAESISDETAARVVNRITLGVPDPDQVIRPSDSGKRATFDAAPPGIFDSVKSDVPGVTLRGTPCP